MSLTKDIAYYRLKVLFAKSVSLPGLGLYLHLPTKYTSKSLFIFVHLAKYLLKQSLKTALVKQILLQRKHLKNTPLKYLVVYRFSVCLKGELAYQ